MQADPPERSEEPPRLSPTGDLLQSPPPPGGLHPLCPHTTTGLQLMNDLNDHIRVVPTNCESLDLLLKGGLREGQVTELVGEAATGKTQVCFSSALASALRGEQVVYLDTTNSFRATRLEMMYQQQVAHMMNHPSLPSSPPPLSEALANILVMRCHDVYSLLGQLGQLEAHLASLSQRPASGVAPPGPVATGPRLLIVDSIPAVLQPILGAVKHTEGQSLALAVIRMLKRLASHYYLAVLVTNYLVTGGNPSAAMRPALGELWRGQPHVRVQLNRGPGGTCCATMLSCTVGGCGTQQGWFNISDLTPR